MNKYFAYLEGKQISIFSDEKYSMGDYVIINNKGIYEVVKIVQAANSGDKISFEILRAADSVEIDIYKKRAESNLEISDTCQKYADTMKLGMKILNTVDDQIDGAKMTGGIGPCGLLLCCSNHLTNFEPISINMAKNQMLALNPNKINGQCGRLLCCLEYENDTYSLLKSKLPKIGAFKKVDNNQGKVIELNVLKGSYTILTSTGERIEVKV